MKIPFRPTRNSTSAASTASGSEVPTRWRPPLAKQEGHHERKWAESTSLAHGLAGYEAWLSAEASLDAAKNIPGEDWGGVLPSLVREAQRVGAAELESVGKTWAQAERKLSARLTARLHQADRRKNRRSRLKTELDGLHAQLAEYFDQAHKTDTLDDDYRRFEGPLSPKTVGFWVLLAILALGELPLTQKAYERLDKSWVIWLAAFSTGVALVGAGHFVGTKSRRLVTLRERWREYLERTEEATKRSELRRGEIDLVKDNQAPMTPKYPVRRPPSGDKLGRRWIVVAVVGTLALVGCFSLGFLRSKQVAVQFQQEESRCQLESQSEIGSTDTETCVAQHRNAQDTTNNVLSNTLLFSSLQVLIFGVAASLTYHRHDEFAEAVRTLRGRIMFVDFQYRRALRAEAKQMTLADRAASERQGEFIARVLETKERRKSYEASIFRVLTIMNRERPDGPSFEIAGLVPQMITLPAWVAASYPLPGKSSDDVYTLCISRLDPEAEPDGPLVGPDIESRATYRRKTERAEARREPTTPTGSESASEGPVDRDAKFNGNSNGSGHFDGVDAESSELFEHQGAQ